MRSVAVLTVAVVAAVAVATPLEQRAAAYYAPSAGGGTELDNAGGGLGEPLNVIISGLSDPRVLTTSGFTNYAEALGFAPECLGIHSGAPQCANLGDGQGCVNQLLELRDDYGSSAVGTCLETLVGGNHLRMFRQSNSGALFLAVSYEENVTTSHTIEANGYNIGRDDLVSTATSGPQSHGGVTYVTTVQHVSGLLAAGSTGVNHGISQDGVVAVLTVTIK